MSKKEVTTKSARKAQPETKKTTSKKVPAKAAVKVGDLVRVPYHDGTAEGQVTKIEKGVYHVQCMVGSGQAEAEYKRNELTPLAAEAPVLTAKAKTAKTKTPKAKAESKGLSGLDAVAKILQEAGTPMKAKPMVEKALADGLWQTTGKTPQATIYAAIIREIRDRGPASRFMKTGKGEFAYNTERKEA